MNNTFNIKRFGKYLLSDLRSCSANFGISFMLLTFMEIIIYAGTILMGLIFDQTWHGPEMGFRAFVFSVCLTVLFLSMPSKCYGHITDKQAGAAWLMIPASALEKFLSMTFITLLVIPAAFFAGFAATDSIICSLDKTCGPALLSIFQKTQEAVAEAQSYEWNMLQDLFEKIASPWIYADDLLGSICMFLLGAIFFKKHKITYTILAIMAVGMATSTITGPLVMSTMNMEAMQNGDITSFIDSPVISHLTVIDTVGDSITLLLCLTGIFFRIKTLKH